MRERAHGPILILGHRPRSEVSVIRHFQERMPYGLFVPEVEAD
jgi:hypothetical protein